MSLNLPTRDVPAPLCGTCRHWHRLPPDPSNLGAPAFGACRVHPPQVVVEPTRGLVTVYPPLPEKTHACSLHKPGDS